MNNFRHSDIQTYYQAFIRDMENIESFVVRDPNDVKIKSILNTDIYTKATRFLEASVKHVVYNCAVIRGDNASAISELSSRLKKFNNPRFEKIKDLLNQELQFDIEDGLRSSAFSGRDKQFLNEIVLNRHRNVHATEDPSSWFSSNNKDLLNFEIEFAGLINIISYIDCITYNGSAFEFIAS